MAAMKEFALWFFSELPDFLLSEPVCYFIGIAIMGFVLKIIFSFFSGNRRS